MRRSSQLPSSTRTLSPNAMVKGRASAWREDRPKSITPMMARTVVTGMVDPPAAPTASTGRPSGSNTTVGAIELRGRLPGSTRLATGLPSIVGERLKSVSSLLR